MSTEQQRIKLLGRIEHIAIGLKFNLEGYVYILGHDDFDKLFDENLLTQITITIDSLEKINAMIMDAVNTLMMKLD